MHKQAILALAAVTAVSLALQLSGYNILEALIFTFAMDMVAVWMFAEKRKKSNYSSLEQVSSLEELCESMSRNIRNIDASKGVRSNDIISTLKSINEKNVALERKIGSFGQHLINTIEKDDSILEN